MRFKIDREQLVKVGKGLLIAMAGAGLTYIEKEAANLDFGDFTPIAVAVNSVFVNFGRKFISKQ